MNTGYIYKIYDNTNNNVYYGSTIQKLSRRLSGHRRSYKNYLNGKYHFVSSFKIIENGDFSISLIEQVEYNDKIELTARERFYIENNGCVNKVIPNRNPKEYREANKEHIKERFKLYREVNKEHIKEQRKIYREANKDKKKEKDKIYRESNKDKIKEQKKLYYEKNKDKVKEQIKLYCEANKNKIKEQKKLYREKIKIREKIKNKYLA